MGKAKTVLLSHLYDIFLKPASAAFVIWEMHPDKFVIF